MAEAIPLAPNRPTQPFSPHEILENAKLIDSPANNSRPLNSLYYNFLRLHHQESLYRRE